MTSHASDPPPPSHGKNGYIITYKIDIWRLHECQPQGIRSSVTVHALNYVLLQKPPPLKYAQLSAHITRMCLLCFLFIS